MFSPLSDGSFLYQRVDFVFYTILLLSITAFLAGEIYWFVQKIKGAGSHGIEKKHFEAAWSLIPLLVLLFLTCIQNQVFSPAHLKKPEVKNTVSAPSHEADEISEIQTIKNEFPKALGIDKSNSAVKDVSYGGK